jgi:hypothetical protein
MLAFKLCLIHNNQESQYQRVPYKLYSALNFPTFKRQIYFVEEIVCNITNALLTYRYIPPYKGDFIIPHTKHDL